MSEEGAAAPSAAPAEAEPMDQVRTRALLCTQGYRQVHVYVGALGMSGGCHARSEHCARPCVLTRARAHTRLQDAPAEGSDAHADASGPGASGSASAGDGGGDALDPEEMIDPIVDGAKLVEIEEMGFPRARAYRALALSGTTTVEGAVNWIIEHSEGARGRASMPPAQRGPVATRPRARHTLTRVGARMQTPTSTNHPRRFGVATWRRQRNQR